MMHILLIHQAYMGGDDAGGTRHYEMGCYLTDNGHRFSVIASTISYLTGKPSSETADEDPYAINVHRAFTYKALHKSYFHRALSFLCFMISSLFTGLGIKDVDIIWGTSPPIFQGLTAWVLSKVKRVPFVFEVRDLWPAFAVDMGVLKNSFLIWIAERVESFLYYRADHLIVNSPAYITHLIDQGASPTKITLVPNGVDTRLFEHVRENEDIAEEYDLVGKFVVLYAGAHGPANDLGVVLRAAQQLSFREDIIFTFVGDGKSKSDLIRMKNELGLSNVRFIEPQPKSKMPAFLSASDAGLAILKDIPMFTTTYPNKVFDYMASGLPTVLAIDGVIREVIDDAGGGVFVPPGDPGQLADTVEYLADHPEVCDGMGQSAKNYVKKHFERKDHARLLEKTLVQLVNNY